jgi:hypothetical protein
MKIEDQDYNKVILNEQQGNDLIREYFSLQKPFFVGRAGITESIIISYIIKHKKIVPEWTKKNAFSAAGINPVSDEFLTEFAFYYSDCMKYLDITAVMSATDYDWVVNTYCPKARYVRLWGLEPYYFNNPWTEFLEDKNVLVVHPFEKSIQNNYKNRENLFENKKVLPKFNLLTIKAEQNQNNQNSNFFKTIDRTKEKIVKFNFDVAIIGCGGCGLPLGSFIKNELNKTVIHMAGATQMLFGIIGRRWEDYPQCQKIINEYWTRPLPEETPVDYNKIENGCYW